MPLLAATGAKLIGPHGGLQVDKNGVTFRNWLHRMAIAKYLAIYATSHLPRQRLTYIYKKVQGCARGAFFLMVYLFVKFKYDIIRKHNNNTF